jgi:hypothetical protein
MTDDIHKNNMYSKDIMPWHSKGRVGTENETCEQVYMQMEPVEFEKREFSITLNDETIGSKNFAIVRKNNGKERIIGITKDRYNLVQPLEYCQIYDSATGQFCETLGFLGTDGEKMFITSKLPGISVYGDKINLYQFLAVGFDGLFGAKQFVTEERVVCRNTYNRAIAEAESTQNHGRGRLYSGKHNEANHLRDLAAWLTYVQKQAEETVQITQGLFCKMEETPMTADEAFGLTKVIYPDPEPLPAFFPDELRNQKQEVIDNKSEKASESRDLVMSLFEGSGIEISKTAYGLWNSTTEAENHHRKSKKEIVYSLLIGNRQGIMENAYSVISDWTVNRNK